jgi:hypothetical protein
MPQRAQPQQGTFSTAPALAPPPGKIQTAPEMLASARRQHLDHHLR